MTSILSNLRPAEGATKKRKRIGRGQGSGHGGTSTRGHKGQHSTTGGKKIKVWFEGGQMPLIRRIPKFGFNSPFRVEYQVINVGRLDELASKGVFSKGNITPEVLFSLGIVSKKSQPIKILGNGDLKNKISISAHSFSKSAKEKISAAGGTMLEIKAVKN